MVCSWPFGVLFKGLACKPSLTQHAKQALQKFGLYKLTHLIPNTSTSQGKNTDIAKEIIVAIMKKSRHALSTMVGRMRQS